MAYFGRGLNKVQNPYNLKDMYASFKASVEKNTPYDIEYKEFMAITEDYLRAVSEGLLAGKRAFKIPFNLGYIEINKRKVDLSNLKRIDWKTSVDAGKRIYHLNEHSDGFNYKIEWERVNWNTRNSKLYVFSPTRKMKRTLAQLIKEKKIDCFQKM